MREQKKVVVFCVASSTVEDWPPSDPAGFISWFSTALNLVPPEYMAKATIKIDSRDEYDGDEAARIQITYARPETDEEMSVREDRANTERLAVERFERKKLAELKGKYE